MKIEKIVTYHVSDPLKEPFKNSIFTLPAIEHVLVEIHAEGLVGYGGAIAYQYVHGEAMHTCAKAYAERTDWQGYRFNPKAVERHLCHHERNRGNRFAGYCVGTF